MQQDGQGISLSHAAKQWWKEATDVARHEGLVKADRVSKVQGRRVALSAKA